MNTQVKTKEPLKVKTLRDTPNTTITTENGTVHGVHHVAADWGEYYVTYLSTGQMLYVHSDQSHDFVHMHISYVQEAWGDAHYYTTKYGRDNTNDRVPVPPHELSNALARIIDAWHGKSFNLVEVMPRLGVIVYRSWFSIGD